MNRIIKFRAWDEQSKVIRSLTQLSLPYCSPPNNLSSHTHQIGEIFAEDELGDRRYELLAPIVMQFTGLTDKNGKEIYEGDIVILHEHNGEASKPLYIAWERDGWELWRKDVALFRLGAPSMDLVEVIGNIYENPELIKQK